MPTLTVKPGEQLNALAARVFPGQDVSRFVEILDLNESLDVFGDLPQELSVNIPDAEQILQYAQPVLSSVSEAIGGAKGAIAQVTGQIEAISGKLPPQLQGYAKQALEAVGQVNGVIGEAEALLEKLPGEATDKLRQYEGEVTRLVPWLLSGKQ